LNQPCKIKDNKKIRKHVSKETSEGPKNRKQKINIKKSIGLKGLGVML
jgi:hypothetical protein